MKTEELVALGLTEEQANQVFAMRGKEITKTQKQISDLETERDDFKTRLATAEDTLKKFDGIDPEKIKSEVETYKKQAEDAEANFSRQITQRDQRDWITQKLDAYGVQSPYARKQLTAECMSTDSGLTWKDGEFFGFDDFMRAAKKQDNTLYLTTEEKEMLEKNAKLEQNAPTFTGPSQGATPLEPNGGEKKFIPPKIF